MSLLSSSKVRLSLLLVALVVIAAACAASANNAMFFGKTNPPAGQILRYVTGSEPESLDPQVGTGQPEGRIYMALYEALCEFDPKTMDPIPGVAERWDVNKDSSEFVFHLRKNARWSNGDPITAKDFLYSFRRGLDPKNAFRNAYLGYYIKYAQGFNEGGVFVRDPTNNTYLLEKDFSADAAKTAGASPAPAEAAPLTPANEYTATAEEPTPDPDTPFHQFIHSPYRLVVPGDEEARAEMVKDNPKLKAALEGKEFEPVKAEHMGVEAVDDFTFRITLTQSAPYFVGLMAHQFFRVVSQKAVEKHHEAWTRPENIITSGPFKLKTWKPYNELIVERDPNYWDAARVQLNEIHFYPMDDNPQIMNLYKAGAVDAVLNHSVPVAWLDMIEPLKDYMDAPEAAITYFQINTTQPPMNDVRVRKAFNMSVDKVAMAKWRKAKPLTAFSPEGVFPGYPQPKGDPFDPVKAKKLLAEAGFKDAAGNYDPKKFPVDKVEITYNTQESNKAVSEFLQAQWKQNLGLTLPMKSMEFKTFLQTRANLEYKGIARSGWIGDYMDPVTFLNLFSTPKGDNGTGWYEPKFVEMLNEANRTLDKQKRYELLAKAEAFLIEAQPVIPLLTDATRWMKKPYVKGLYPNPGTMHAWKFVCIERDPAKWDYGIPSMTDKELPICTK